MINLAVPGHIRELPLGTLCSAAIRHRAQPQAAGERGAQECMRAQPGAAAAVG